MSDLFALFDAGERAGIAELIRPAQHTDPLPPHWPVNGIPPHPYASINRMMTGDEARELRADIEAHGLLERIVVFEDKILDGRNRYLECVALGRFTANVDWRTHPDFVEFCGKGWDVDRGSEPLAFVWGMEVRRHRSAKDTALAAARYLRFIAELRPETPEAKTAKLRLPTQADLAKRHGISERLVNSAMVLLDRAEPEVVAAVEQGTLALTDAADVVSKMDKIEQRIIAENPDRKSVKAAVKLAKNKPLPAPMPELPSPISRTELATFAEELVHLARAAIKKHNFKKGASISADTVMELAIKHEIVDGSTGWAFSRQMQLALGKLRDMPEPAAAKQKDPGTGPTDLPLGGEWSLKIGGFKGKNHWATIQAFHEADDTYSVRYDWQLSGRGAASPYQGAYASLREAIGVVAGWMLERLDGLGDDQPDKASATAAAGWLRGRLAEWRIDIVTAPAPPGTGAPPDPEAVYAAALKAGEKHRGKHTIKTAEPILKAADAAGVAKRKIADDTGIPIGSVSGWSGRLGLQKAERNPVAHGEGASA